MTNSAEQPSSRLDRIEAALDRQVAVNADLRTSVEVLRSSIESLLQVANQHQENFMVIVREIREMRVDMQVMQSEIRGLQTENRRILDRLERQEGQDE